VKILFILLLLSISPFVGRAQQEASSSDITLGAGVLGEPDVPSAEILNALQAVDPEIMLSVLQPLDERVPDSSITENSFLPQSPVTTPPGMEPVLSPKLTFNPPPEPAQETLPRQPKKSSLPQETEDIVARLKPIFVAQQVPAELIWLAEVESAFHPSALSPTGAAGLFQLKPATAMSVGLSLWPTDERMDPEENARGAARYLKTLRKRFKDWPLALAAYRVGETRIQTLLDQHNTRTYDGIAEKLPEEAQTYLSKVTSTLQRREGVSLSALPVPE
jgi:hypothetical protein